MKPINFISPIPEQKKKEVRRWILLSSFLGVGLILFLSISLFERCYHYYILRSQRIHAEQDHTHCQLVLQTHKEKELTSSTTMQRLTKLTRYHNQPNSIAGILRSCMQKIGTGSMQSCTLAKHAFELSYKSPSITQAQNTLKLIATIPGITDPQLISLQRNNNIITNTVRAQLNKG